MFCPHCADANPDDAKYCGKCGRALTVPVVGDPPPPPPPPPKKAAAKLWFIAAGIGFLFYVLIQCSESGTYSY